MGLSLFSVESLLTCKVFVLKFWTQVLLCCVLPVKTPFFTRRQFWPSGIVVACVCVSVCQSWACPHDNSPLVQARITKFGTKVHKTLVKVPIVFGDDRPSPSRSNLTWKSNFTSFWACPPHNSSAVQAIITKFGPKMHLSTVKIPIDFGLD